MALQPKTGVVVLPAGDFTLTREILVRRARSGDPWIGPRGFAPQVLLKGGAMIRLRIESRADP